MSRELEGRAVFITGGSSGLGEHFARLCARSGARVAIASRRMRELETLADSLLIAGAPAVAALTLDVTDENSVAAAVAQAQAQLGFIDVLINNAGIALSGPALDQTTADFDAVVNTNLRGVWLVATEMAKAWRRAQRDGNIINIASILGLRQAVGVASYAISKAGVIQMTKTLALELARFNIRVNALAPGYIATPLNHDFFESEAGKEMVRRVPMRRLGQLQDLDGPLLLLATDASRFMTGSVIVVDGGHNVNSL